MNYSLHKSDRFGGHLINLADTFSCCPLSAFTKQLARSSETISLYHRERELGYTTISGQLSGKTAEPDICTLKGEPCTISVELNVDETNELNLDQLIDNQQSP